MIARVTPIYGNGWTDGIETLDVPAPFDVNLDSKEDALMTGIITSQTGSYAGCRFEAEQRWIGDESTYNCTIGGEALDCDLHGYCTIKRL